MRPIDADELVAWGVETYQVQSTSEGKAYVNAFLTWVDSCHALDAVEVVRCKDCVQAEICPLLPAEKLTCGRTDYIVNGDDFCSYGERREK